jgi:hypothetical protein
VGLCIPLSLLGSGSVSTFTLQRRTVGGVVFYAVSLASKERRRIVLPRSFCFLCCPVKVQGYCHGLIIQSHRLSSLGHHGGVTTVHEFYVLMAAQCEDHGDATVVGPCV